MLERIRLLLLDMVKANMIFAAMTALLSFPRVISQRLRRSLMTETKNLFSCSSCILPLMLPIAQQRVFRAVQLHSFPVSCKCTLIHQRYQMWDSSEIGSKKGVKQVRTAAFGPFLSRGEDLPHSIRRSSNMKLVKWVLFLTLGLLSHNAHLPILDVVYLD